MFELTIKQKILLAEKVMGWKKYNIKDREQKGFYCVFTTYPEDRKHFDIWGSGNWREWRPETDEGDAARLLMALPHNWLETSTDENGNKIFSANLEGKLQWVESFDYCETICRLALAHAEDLRNESNA